MSDPALDTDAAWLWLIVPALPVLILLFQAGCP
jgi:hypothetical protein